MSRFKAIKKTDKNVTVFYGLDHILSWWYEEWIGSEAPTIERDTFSGNLTRGEFVELLEQTTAPKEHIHNIVLDLDPAK